MDEYETSGYERIRITVPGDGTICWAYAWRSAAAGFAHLPYGWPADRLA